MVFSCCLFLKQKFCFTELRQTILFGGGWKKPLTSPEPMRTYNHFSNNPGSPGKNFKKRFRAVDKKKARSAKQSQLSAVFQNISQTVDTDTENPPAEDVQKSTPNEIGSGVVTMAEELIERITPIVAEATGTQNVVGDVTPIQDEEEVGIQLTSASPKRPSGKKTPSMTSCLPVRTSRRLRGEEGQNLDFGPFVQTERHGITLIFFFFSSS